MVRTSSVKLKDMLLFLLWPAYEEANHALLVTINVGGNSSTSSTASISPPAPHSREQLDLVLDNPWRSPSTKRSSGCPGAFVKAMWHKGEHMTHIIVQG